MYLRDSKTSNSTFRGQFLGHLVFIEHDSLWSSFSCWNKEALCIFCNMCQTSLFCKVHNGGYSRLSMASDIFHHYGHHLGTTRTLLGGWGGVSSSSEGLPRLLVKLMPTSTNPWQPRFETVGACTPNWQQPVRAHNLAGTLAKRWLYLGRQNVRRGLCTMCEAWWRIHTETYGHPACRPLPCRYCIPLWWMGQSMLV